MKRLILISILILFSFSLYGELKYRRYLLPDPIPETLRDCYSADTLISGMWIINTEGYIVFPTLLAYIVQDDMTTYISWPSRSDALEDAFGYWSYRTDSLIRNHITYYDDGKVRVFIDTIHR